MKISKKENKTKYSEMLFDYYLALDWSEKNSGFAWMSSTSTKPTSMNMESDLKQVKDLIKSKSGKKILTIEETTTTHWLYVELRDSVDRLLVCDPYRNALLSEGPKNDKYDARKLCLLLRSGMLKEVFHSLDEDYKIRKLVSSYEDIVKAGVRVLNQKSANYRALGLKVRHDKLPEEDIYNVIEKNHNRSIELYKEQKQEYKRIFEKLKTTNKVIGYLCGISGIAEINAVKIYSKVIDAARFQSKYKYWAYCGLVKYDKDSGKKSYGKKETRYSRTLKAVYKQAAQAAIGGKNDIREYYEYLLREKRLSETVAKKQVMRYIAKVSYGVMLNKSSYRPYQWRETPKEKVKEEKIVK
jgi:transposase